MCAGGVISAHVLADDPQLRDALIEEYQEQHGAELLECVFDFVHYHAIASVEQLIAANNFSFVLNGLGTVIEALADELDLTSFEITMRLATAELQDSAAPEREVAIRSAQTCLIIHMLVRKGEEPWGVQQNLDHEDMCVVVRALGDLMWTLITDAAEVLGDHFLIAQLLVGVHGILNGLAGGYEMALPDLLADYWGQLALADRQD